MKQKIKRRKERKKEFTIDEAADYIRVNKATLWRWRKAAIGPNYISRGGRYYYQKKEIDRWKKEGDQNEQ